MKEYKKWLLASAPILVSLAVCAKTTLACDADKDGISHSLEITEKGNGVPEFSYLSSSPSQGLALNCVIDSSLVNGTPMVFGNTVTYPLDGDGSLSITKQMHGCLLDMSKLDAADYCSGIMAKKVIIRNGNKKCKIQ